MNVLNKAERKKTESAWHDEWVSGKGREVVFYDTPFLQSLVADLEDYAMLQLCDLTGKKVLYYGSGVNLKPTIRFIDKGATVYMIDISPKSIKFLSSKIKELGLEKRVFPSVMDCENLTFDDNYFDVVYGRAILHHLDLAKALSEIKRVLKPNGLSVFIEPLGMNPLINLYRKMTPSRRTPDEKAFDEQAFEIMGKTGFSNFRHKEFTFFCNIGIFLNSLLKVPQKLAISYKLLKKLDDFVIANYPLVRKHCWNTVIIFSK